MQDDWSPKTAINAICFDCDGTLSALEGINELARYSNVSEQVESLTQIAMSETGITPEIYSARLKLIFPNKKHLLALADEYYTHCAEDIIEVLQLYKNAGKAIFIVSAGMNPAVKLFGEKLQIPSTHIFAVNLFFDDAGNYLHYDTNSPLIHNDGKRLIIEELHRKYPNILHIGDGLNDVATQDMVSRFVGYGGFFYREHIEQLCQFYIRSQSMSALLPLSLTNTETKKLSTHEQGLYQKGIMAIKEGTVKI